MHIDTLDVHGMMASMIAMRNPMNSWDRSDTYYTINDTEHGIDAGVGLLRMLDAEKTKIGPNDKELSLKLQKAGPEHCKHLRMIMVWADIEAPRYWWQEFDTYRHGVEKVSCSTMHKLTSRPVTKMDFEFDPDDEYISDIIDDIIPTLNILIKACKTNNDPDAMKANWRALIQALPQSYIQKRTVMMSYAALRNIVRQREGHKLKEWKAFIDWAHTLPESWMIFDEE